MITKQALFHGPSTLSARPTLLQSSLSLSGLRGLGSFGDDDGSSVLDDLWASATGAGSSTAGSTQTWSGQSNGYDTAGYVSQQGEPLKDCATQCRENNLPMSPAGLSCNKGYAPTQVECGCWSCRPSTSSTPTKAVSSGGTGTAGAPKTPPKVENGEGMNISSVLSSPLVIAGGLVALGLGYLVYKKKSGKISSSYVYSGRGY